jgi:hypothetical protein
MLSRQSLRQFFLPRRSHFTFRLSHPGWSGSVVMKFRSSPIISLILLHLVPPAMVLTDSFSLNSIGRFGISYATVTALVLLAYINLLRLPLSVKRRRCAERCRPTSRTETSQK